jgi:1,4-alpha-glucan branching enzyme
MKTLKEKRSKKVIFSLHAPEAGSVILGGDFNNWDQTKHAMKKDKKGVWKVSLSLPPGTHQYRFFVDGEWRSDPASSDFVGNPFGTVNCVRQVE